MINDRRILLSMLLICFAHLLVIPAWGSAQMERLQTNVAPLMDMSLEELADWVPVESGGLYFVDCPACQGGSQDRGRFEWKPDEPFSIRCLHCDQGYPDNADYPENAVVVVPYGETEHVFRYHLSEDREKGYFFQAHADWWRRVFLENGTRDLAELYRLTGDDRYAERAAVLLTRFAEVYPEYVLKYDFPFHPVQFAEPGTGPIEGVRVYRTSKWSWWGIMDVSEALALAYNDLREWPGWEALGGDETRRRIREDLLAGMVRSVLEVEGWERSGHLPRVAKLVASRTIGSPEMVHESIRRFKRMRDEFYYDGGYRMPAPSYMAQMSGTFQVWIQAAKGYSDPPGYVDAVSGERYDDLDLSQLPFVDRALSVYSAMRFPDDRMIPINDTWGGSLVPAVYRKQKPAPILFPGTGLAVLTGGHGPNAWLLYLDFTSASAPHAHRVSLSMGFYLGGVELLSDIGYTHSSMRLWARSSMAHSTVVVDGTEVGFDPGLLGNRVYLYDVSDRNFQIAGALSRSAYPGKVTNYRRTLAALSNGGQLAYVLDLFEVTGGSQQDYLLLGPLAKGGYIRPQVGGNLIPVPQGLLNEGVVFTKPQGQNDRIPPDAAFGFYQNVKALPAETPPVLDIGQDSVAVRAWLTADNGDTIYLADVPSVRAAKESEAAVWEHWAPMMAWRKGGNSLASTFATVFSPQGAAMGVKAVHREDVNGVLRMRIELKNGMVDHWLLQAGDPSADRNYNGSITWMRMAEDGSIQQYRNFGGVSAEHGGESLPGGGIGRGVLLEAGESATGGGEFLIEGSWPEVASGLLTLQFPDRDTRSFRIKEVEELGEGKYRVLTYEAPGFVINKHGIRFTAFPQREWTGQGSIRYQVIGMSAH